MSANSFFCVCNAPRLKTGGIFLIKPPVATAINGLILRPKSRAFLYVNTDLI